ncbi:hypothetical protein DXC34_14130 [Bacteroides stercoris]|uniref:Virulence protein n=1 Tax=Bacteroides stercoris TaxID=46506 RepID=A0A3E4ULW8_BACSE|nr:RhuM family protein [Bacteroides stercoris]RGM11279.1 hypothetical protein DXC34_14130 [Bacteroides stercoris]
MFLIKSIRCSHISLLCLLSCVELFSTTKQNISLHTNTIFKEKELLDGKYCTLYYNLDVIIFIYYRAKSIRGTRFYQWFNKVLKDYY